MPYLINNNISIPFRNINSVTLKKNIVTIKFSNRVKIRFDVGECNPQLYLESLLIAIDQLESLKVDTLHYITVQSLRDIVARLAKDAEQTKKYTAYVSNVAVDNLSIN